MRTEQEMLDLIINTAREDERIRAVYLNGSRTNPNAPKDLFQDYDVIYVVEETESFRQDRSWIDRFGRRLYMQYPEDSPFFPSEPEKCYGWLMQFADGNRLDLHVETAAFAAEDIKSDRLCRILLDKDGILPEIPEETDADHWVKRPSEPEFLCCCNEFWWCLNNVGKGIWRNEIPYAQSMLFLIREELVRVLSWKIGTETEFKVSIGKNGKYMYRYLSKEDWESFLATYAGGSAEELWDAAETMCGLFDRTAGETALRLGFDYNEEEAKGSFSFFRRVRHLPQDAEEIY